MSAGASDPAQILLQWVFHRFCFDILAGLFQGSGRRSFRSKFQSLSVIHLLSAMMMPVSRGSVAGYWPPGDHNL
jgi:hypothetical protein